MYLKGVVMKLDNNSKKIISYLTASGYKAYAVGGCVRDALMNKAPKDIDITTSATPEQMEAVFDKNDVRYVETGIKHGTVSAILDHAPYEVTTFRVDGDYKDSRHPDSVNFVTDIEKDLSRRDFTMNAIAYNDEEGYVDLFGGVEDIKNGVIRCVGDANKRFNEDALRILRAIRFSSLLGFEIEAQTKKAIFENKDLLLNIAYERIYVELVKTLLGDNVEKVLLEYRDVIAVVVPEIKDTFDFPQNSKWHIYDVYTHIVKSVAVATKKDYVRLAVFLHDIGKPFTKTTDDKGQDHFYKHPVYGADLARKALKRLKVSNDIYHKTIMLIELHDAYIYSTHKSIKKWLRVFGDELIYDFIDIKIADLKTHTPELANPEIENLLITRAMVDEVIASGEAYEISHLAINGNDLIQLGYVGSEIKEELELLLSRVIGSPNLNNREQLIKIAKKDKEYNK